MLEHSGSFFPQLFKGALLCVACDIAVARKVCGFTGHASAAGCSKCTKKFETGGIGTPSDLTTQDLTIVTSDKIMNTDVKLVKLKIKPAKMMQIN